MNKYHKSINYLLDLNTQNIPHSGKNFFDHCVNVYNILNNCKFDEDVCFAGLFHSIYGNDIFTTGKQLNVSREDIKSIIGERAESLVNKFNTVPREKLWQDDDQDIKNILVANELDNKPLFEIFDNVFDDKTIDLLYAVFRDQKRWLFGGHGVDPNNRKLNAILSNKNKIDNILFDCANKIIKQNNLDNFVTYKRAYASGYLHGTIHDLHTDDGADQYNKVFTIMFYLNKVWNITYAGETVFLHNNEMITSVLPKAGRAVLFDGSIPHLARDPSRICSELRMVATFKYKVGKNV
tara:strand:- start:2726 stop:3607 length:882 start_codon:yes stop_codon:yes gene_type:complete